MGTQVNWSALEKIPGWLAVEAAQIAQRIASHPIPDGVLEFGVFKGKLLSLSAALFNGPVVGVDAMWNGINNPLTGTDLESAIAQVLAAVKSVAPGAEPHLIVSDTMLITVADISKLAPNGFGFISVDAGHDADPVCHDMNLAASLLAPGGVIFADDVFNDRCPGVAEGTFRFLASDNRLKAFATGYNKTMFTDAASHSMWLGRAYEWAANGEGAMYERTRAQIDANIASLGRPMLGNGEIVPFC